MTLCWNVCIVNRNEEHSNGKYYIYTRFACTIVHILTNAQRQLFKNQMVNENIGNVYLNTIALTNSCQRYKYVTVIQCKLIRHHKSLGFPKLYCVSIVRNRILLHLDIVRYNTLNQIRNK